MPLLILVEDKIIESYEILARNHLGLERRDRSLLKVQKIELNEVDSLVDWQSLIEDACQTNFDCVVVVIDEEVAWRSTDRPNKLQKIRRAFFSWCDYAERLPNGDSSKNALVSLVISKTCLESWILADAQAVVAFAASGRGVKRYKPKQSGRTEHFDPRRAKNQITQIIQNVDRERKGRSRRSYEKSSSPEICHCIDLNQASQNKVSHTFCSRSRAKTAVAKTGKIHNENNQFHGKSVIHLNRNSLLRAS
jgi:hypothetical protein